MDSADMINAYTEHQAYVLRVLSVTASCLSIGAGLLAFYLYVSMRVKVFRHHLILLLLMFDFGKAVVLLWYPARVLLVPLAYNNTNFCDVVGFFSSAFIEGADLAVLSLAIHTALLVFTKSSTPEGGLYKYRYYVYGITFLLPLVMASLAFISHGRHSYFPQITWCYLPINPIWYRLVLSWIPRYIIIVSILSIYISIYIYVKLEYAKVVKDFKQSQTYLHKDFRPNSVSSASKGKSTTKIFTWFTKPFNSSDASIRSTEDENQENTQSQAAKKKFSFNKLATTFKVGILRFISYFPGFSFLEPSRQNGAAVVDNTEMLDVQAIAIREFQKDTMAKFQVRRNMIERQIRSIFVYPVAYVFLWLAPFAVHCLQFNYEPKHGPIFWIGAIAAFMQPFNCVVDTIAFMVRERPWRDRKERIFTKDNGDRVKYYLWCLVPCSGERRSKYRKDKANSAVDADTTAREISNDRRNNVSHDVSMAFSAFDADLERFVGNKSNNNDGSNQSSALQSSASDNSTLEEKLTKRGPSISTLQAAQRQRQPGDVFLQPPRRPTWRSQESDEESEGSMDLMEFLR